MSHYNKIVVACDGSDAGTQALNQALKLVQDYSSSLVIVTVTPPPQADFHESVTTDLVALVKKQGETFLKTAGEIAKQENIEPLLCLEEGEIHEQIIAVAERENSDLIVMGRRGMTGLERILMGSETNNIIGHFNGKVLVIPKEGEIKWETIVIATDGSAFSDAAIDEAIKLAKDHGSVLKVLSVSDVSEEYEAQATGLTGRMIDKTSLYLETLKDEIEKEGVQAEIFVKSGQPYEEIIDFAEENKAGLIVMGSHGRTGLKRLFMGSVTSRVIGHTKCPVMVVKVG
ncbi:MAG: universal stress protein [Nitrospira sp.]|nr:universal stress protein [bacterium]MBL7049791.1 universal stress protein [Nitrospira sp.]